MSLTKPFKAVHYNPDKIPDLSEVVCPPYDVITKEEQNDFYNMNKYNFVRILLGKDKAGDNGRENRYQRAKAFYTEWQKKGILKQDEESCVYFYRQDYKVLGVRNSRLGFITLMRLQDGQDSRIYPHEYTHPAAKEDRLRLWRILKSNLSCIFVCFSDKDRLVEKVFNKTVSLNAPYLDVTDRDGVRHQIWKLDDPQYIDEINNIMEDQQLFIADGHHRYEVANELKKIRMKNRTKVTGQEDFNYVMTYFTNMDSKGLHIFPVHRVIRKMPKKLDFFEEYFRIDRVRSKEELMILLAKAGRNENAFGFYAKDGIKLLRLKSKTLIDKFIKEGSKEYRNLDVNILKHFILDKIGIRSDHIIYTKDVDVATRKVDERRAEACFILNPIKI